MLYGVYRNRRATTLSKSRVFNILTGMFVEQALQFALPDNEDLVREQRRVELEDRCAMDELSQREK